MSEHPIAAQILDQVTQANFWSESFAHEPVRTSEDAAQLRADYSLQQGAKAIILRVKIPSEGKKFVMLVMPGDKRFDSAKTKDILKSRDIRFATEEEVETVTGGIKPGGVPPFGNLFGIEVIVDTSLFNNDKIIFNAGRNFSIALKSAEYTELVKPRIADICQ